MKTLSALALLGLVIALPALAADPVIYKGTDLWTTPKGSGTVVSFANNPIPAGFFCPGSAPFTGKIALHGRPLVTGLPGQLPGIDTIVERLDDARFDTNGVTLSRVRMRALSLVSSAPVETSCGRFRVSVSLAGEQRITTMRIVRQNELGGVFTAPLAVDARLVFRPVLAGSAQPKELLATVTFQGATAFPWSFGTQKGGLSSGPVLVDTNGDGKAETLLPGTSNFVAGWRVSSPIELVGACGYTTYCCHDDGTGQLHCVQICGNVFCDA